MDCRKKKKTMKCKAKHGKKAKYLFYIKDYMTSEMQVMYFVQE